MIKMNSQEKASDALKIQEAMKLSGGRFTYKDTVGDKFSFSAEFENGDQLHDFQGALMQLTSNIVEKVRCPTKWDKIKSFFKTKLCHYIH